jgi:hypothetical protein
VVAISTYQDLEEDIREDMDSTSNEIASSPTFEKNALKTNSENNSFLGYGVA